MPWEITIINGSTPADSTLGDHESVILQLSAALPGTTLSQPPSMPDELLASMPESVRAMMNHPRLEGCFDHPEFPIALHCPADEPIRFINGEVRGDGDPVAALKTLCDATGWSIWDRCEAQVIDFSELDLNGWEAFCEWRDRAISETDTQT